MQQGSILPFLKKSRSSRPENSRPGQPYSRRPTTNSDKHNAKNNASRQHRGPNRRRNMHLKAVADETKAQLPKTLDDIPDFNAAESSIHNLNELDAVDSKDCPGFVLKDDDAEAGKIGCRIRVLDMDTFDAALLLNPDYKVHTHLGVDGQNKHVNQVAKDNDTDTEMNDASTQEDIIKSVDAMEITQSTTSTTNLTLKPPTPPFTTLHRPTLVLNLASERSAGGGWQNGALAQEECLCYRSSLYLSLHKSYYPLPSLSAIYSPHVLLIRDSMSRGHALLTPHAQPLDLPALSVISVAALRHPSLSHDKKAFKSEGARAETKRKIRLTLRVAARQGHTRLVLGALGCGVFANPPREVAVCFLEVLREKEFAGGWWEEVVFAVLDNVKGPDGGKDGDGNFGQFYRVLHGEVV